ncbi:MAG TPA: cupin domain-containing protein [Rhizomicrobium sp.]|jgi:quercetin dioxygenase-like cupin family protein|nr:cupin domain-containing protein [Rhizomicrobium sp.]
MTFIDTSALNVVERRPGWRGRFFDSGAMTFGHYEFDTGADIHAHAHEQEEVWHVLEGRLAITIGGETVEAGPGFVGIVPPNVTHSVVALSDGKATVVDTPRRAIPGVG